MKRIAAIVAILVAAPATGQVLSSGQPASGTYTSGQQLQTYREAASANFAARANPSDKSSAIDRRETARVRAARRARRAAAPRAR